MATRAKQGGIRRIVIGLDGSAPSRRAVVFLTRLTSPPGGHVLCGSVLERTRVPSMPFLPESVRGAVVGQVSVLIVP